MKSSDAFGVAIRTVGLLIVLSAVLGFCCVTLMMFLGRPLNMFVAGPEHALVWCVLSAPALLVGGWLLRGAPALVEFAYQSDRERPLRRAASTNQFGPEVVATAANEIEAAAIVAALADRDIEASTTGEYTAGFRAEAPGRVNVVVWHRDRDRARAALAEIKSGVDWSQVDVGEPED